MESKKIGQFKSFFLKMCFASMAALPLSLVFLFKTLPLMQTKIENSKQDKIKTAVESVFLTLDFYHQKQIKGELTETQAKDLAKTFIKSMRYNDNEYFWINDLTPTMVMHPFKPELDGKNIGETKDPTGKKLFIEMVNVVKASQSGYVDYMWPKPGQKEAVGKISYVKLYEPWGWIVGSGVYTDDVKVEIAAAKNENLIWFAIATFFGILISLAVGIYDIVKVINPVKKVINQLSHETELLTEMTGVLTKSSDQLGSAGQTQSASIHQTASAMTEMTEMMNKTAQSAQQASQLSFETQEIAKQGQEYLESLKSNIELISEKQNKLQSSVNDNLSKLDSVVGIIAEISEKTKVIDDIVFQTKLLSFNASVEAARAGEHGKGFAVVAEEVGNLARMSGSASIEIAQIVSKSNSQVKDLAHNIQSELNMAIKEIQEAIEESVEHSNKSLETLAEVVNKSVMSNEMVQSISQANVEQSKGSNEVLSAIRTMEDTNQNLNLIVTESEKLADNLIHRSDELNNLSRNLEKIVSISKNNKTQKNYQKGA